MNDIDSDNAKSQANVPSHISSKKMSPSTWLLLYMRPITKEEMKVVEELRRIEGQHVYLLYLYDSH
jgi:hypothetical protein